MGEGRAGVRLLLSVVCQRRRNDLLRQVHQLVLQAVHHPESGQKDVQPDKWFWNLELFPLWSKAYIFYEVTPVLFSDGILRYKILDYKLIYPKL